MREFAKDGGVNGEEMAKNEKVGRVFACQMELPKPWSRGVEAVNEIH